MDTHYFIGIEPPAALSKAIRRLQRELYMADAVQEPLLPHLTLLPPPALGKTDPAVFQAADGQLAGLLPLTVRLTSIEIFDRRAVALRADAEGLAALHDRLLACIPEPAGWEQFAPHVTIAQALRGEQLSDAQIQAYGTAADRLLPAHFTVRRLSLFRWQGPRRYTAEPLIPS